VAGGRTGAGEALSFFFDGAGDELRLGAMLVGKTPGPVLFSNFFSVALEGAFGPMPFCGIAKTRDTRPPQKSSEQKSAASEKGTGNAVPSKRFHLVTHIANLR
jgi:hypothetical protein